jgi:hypothetical protein
MNGDLRTSLKLWVDVIAFVGFMLICGAVLRACLSQASLDAVIDKMPLWVWLLVGVCGLWSIGHIGWGLWQRRASKTN